MNRLGRASASYAFLGAGVVAAAVVVVSLFTWLPNETDRAIAYPIEAIERIFPGVMEQVDDQVASLLGVDEETAQTVRKGLVDAGSVVPQLVTQPQEIANARTTSSGSATPSVPSIFSITDTAEDPSPITSEPSSPPAAPEPASSPAETPPASEPSPDAGTPPPATETPPAEEPPPVTEEPPPPVDEPPPAEEPPPVEEPPPPEEPPPVEEPPPPEEPPPVEEPPPPEEPPPTEEPPPSEEPPSPPEQPVPPPKEVPPLPKGEPPPSKS